MGRTLLGIAACFALTACGLADVGVSGGVAAASKADEIKQGIQTERRVQEQLDAAQQKAAEQRAKAEADAQ